MVGSHNTLAVAAGTACLLAGHCSLAIAAAATAAGGRSIRRSSLALEIVAARRKGWAIVEDSRARRLGMRREGMLEEKGRPVLVEGG